MHGDRRRSALGSAVLALSLLAGSRVAAADVPDSTANERASRTFAAAQAAFAQGSFAAAGAAFEEAARAIDHPATWLNAAEAWDRAGDFVRAAEACDRARGSAGAADPSFFEEASRRLVRFDQLVGQVVVEGPRTRVIYIDGEGPFPVPMRKRVAPGRHVVRVSDLATGETRERAVEIRMGSILPAADLVVEPEVKRPIDRGAEAPVDRGTRVPTATWVTLGLAGGLAAAGGAFGVLTLNAKSEFESDPTRDNLDRFYRDRTITNVLFVGVAVAAVIGVVLWAGRPSKPVARAN